MRASTTLIFAAATGFAAASPAATTTTNTPAACVYTTIGNAESTAFAANMPNPNLTVAKIEQYWEDFEFACEYASNFTAHILTTSTLSPKPWFGGGWYRGQDSCHAADFDGIVSQCMTQDNPSGNSNVNCVAYQGGSSTPFQKAAGQYFASLKT